MIEKSNLTDSECLALIRYASDTLTSKNTESAVASIVKKLRISFDVSCIRIREIISRPCSLRYTYESLRNPAKFKHINETVTFDTDNWHVILKKFSEGIFTYKAGSEQTFPQFIGSASDMPMCMLQIPMYSENKFLGIMEISDYEKIHEWKDCELSALKICANIICQYLYRINSSFINLNSRNDIDSLTGLMSFHGFTEKLDEKFSEMLSDAPIAVVYTDIQHFKYINETYGYKKGDELLKLIAMALKSGSEGFDIMMCRVHADHFVTAAAIPEEILEIFDKFIAEQNSQLSKLLQDNCPDVRIHIVTGICYVRNSSMTAATAIANANLARKVAKAENIHHPLIFSNEMMEAIKYQEYLNNELPKAIQNHNLKVYYQPKINCADESLYGAEALVRWQKPDGTFIYPDKFIPVFEKNGNIMDVDFYVYREVFKYIRGRLDSGLPVFPISMNVSRIHFRTNKIIPYIESLMAEYKIPSELVEFELTENIYMNNFSKADEFIKSCRNRGIQVSMDDFGSGYSSLNVISSISIDTLKIDKIFLKNDNLSDNDKTVIESMIAMAKRLGMKVICEGVETESQTAFLKNTQCDQIQGYYYGRPMNEESFNQFVENPLPKHQDK